MGEAYEPFDRAARLLHGELRLRALGISDDIKVRTEELRLRVGQPLHLTLPEGELPLWGTEVSTGDLEQVLDEATEFSRYTAARSIRQGYLTAPGGFRVGVCGRIYAGPEGGLQDISSVAIRIPRPCRGIAESVLPALLAESRPLSTLILSSPGGGKTTLLRDLVRLLGNGTESCPPLAVSLVDERGELAAMYRGRPQMDVGRQTDVMEGLAKSAAVPILLRAMRPQVIALDEIALPEDVDAVRAAAGCGAVLLATIHAPSLEDLRQRPLGQALLSCSVFRRAVILSLENGRRRSRVEELT